MMALRDIQGEVMLCAISIPKKLRAMRERVKRYILPEKENGPKIGPFAYQKLDTPLSQNTLN